MGKPFVVIFPAYAVVTKRRSLDWDDPASFTLRRGRQDDNIRALFEPFRVVVGGFGFFSKKFIFYLTS